MDLSVRGRCCWCRSGRAGDDVWPAEKLLNHQRQRSQCRVHRRSRTWSRVRLVSVPLHISHAHHYVLALEELRNIVQFILHFLRFSQSLLAFSYNLQILFTCLLTFINNYPDWLTSESVSPKRQAHNVLTTSDSKVLLVLWCNEASSSFSVG